MRIKKFVLILLSILLISVPVIAANNTEEILEQTDTGENQQKERIAFVINGEDFTKEVSVNELDLNSNLKSFVGEIAEVDRKFTQLLVATDEGKELLDEYRKTKVENMVLQILLEKEAKERGYEWTESEKEEYYNNQFDEMKKANKDNDGNEMNDEQLEEAIKQRYQVESLEEYKQRSSEILAPAKIVGKMTQEIIGKVKVTDEDIEKHYNENIENYKHGPQVKVNHIYLRDEKTAKEVKEKLNNGADFAEMAKEYSLDKSTKDKGGDLGFIEQNEYGKEIGDAVAKLEKGQVSGVVKSTMGYHIIKKTGERGEGTTSLEEAKDTIEEGLLREKRNEIWQNLLKELRDKVTVDVKL